MAELKVTKVGGKHYLKSPFGKNFPDGAFFMVLP